MGSLEEDLLSNEGFRHFWLSGWGGARKSASCPCLTAEALLSLFFHCLQQEPFHNDLPTVISLLKAAALGAGRGGVCIEPLCGSWSFVLGFACRLGPSPCESLCCSDAQALGHLLKDNSKVARILRLSHLGVSGGFGGMGVLGTSAGVISDKGGVIMSVVHGPAQRPWQ